MRRQAFPLKIISKTNIWERIVRLFFQTRVQGPWTKEDGYMGYFELCKWNTKINPDIQSAVATTEDWTGKKWGGFETLESAENKLK